MKKLALYHAGEMEFGDDGARQVASYIHHMEVLRLNSCNMTSLGVEALSLALRQQRKQVHLARIFRKKFSFSMTER